MNRAVTKGGCRLAAVALAAACCAGPRTLPPDAVRPDVLAEAERRVREGTASAEDLARAGWAAYLVHSDLARAEQLFVRGAAMDPAEAYNRYGLAETAAARADDRRAAALLLALVMDAPAHRLAPLALRRVAALGGTSPAQDLDVDAGLSALLARGAPVEVAQVARLELGRLRERRGDLAGAARAREEAGVVTRWVLAGPLSALRALDFAAPLSAAAGRAPFFSAEGFAVVPPDARPLEAPDGWVSAETAGPRGGTFAALSDIDAESGEHQLLFEFRGSAQVVVDGVLVHEARAWEHPTPALTAVRLWLSSGTHRILVRFARGDGPFRVSLAPASGAPARLGPRPAFGPAPGGTARLVPSSPPPPEHPGDPLAAYLRAQELARVDHEGALEALERALAAAARCGPCLALRADLVAEDPDLPHEVARGRALRDLNAALGLVRGHAAGLITRAAAAHRAERWDDAARDLAAAFQASPGAPRVAVARARLALARGDELGARRELAEAETLQPGRCDAAEVALDLAQRRQDLASADRAVLALAACPGGRARLAAHRRARGDLAGALAIEEELRAADPGSPEAHLAVVDALVAIGDLARAQVLAREAAAAWPALVAPQRKLADVLELAGDMEGAARAREEALRLDGSNLPLRRMHLADAACGPAAAPCEPLGWAARDGRAAIEAYRNRGRASAPGDGAGAVMVLDHGAVEVHEDGSWTERVHTVTHILDKSEVEKQSEVRLPPGAEALWVRTLKADGTALEPESLAKEGYSLPGVEPGDFVESAYLLSHGARGGALPGFTAPPFYFRTFDLPLFESEYQVRAPAGTGLLVDLHNLQADARVQIDGVSESWSFSARNVPAFIGEPRTVAESELLPFVQVGAGAGSLDYGRALGDQVAPLFRVTREIRAFARAAQAAAGAGRERVVRAVAARVADAVRGRGDDFSEPAAASLARGRGSRLTVLRAALSALGIPSRVALVRTFDRDPAPFRFPRPELYGLAVLRVPLENGRTCWIDLSVRQNPVCALPPTARGREALLLAEPGADAVIERTPEADEVPDGREIELDLTLSEDGTLRGRGLERYKGFDGAAMRAALEAMDGDQRRRAVEQMLNRSLRGLALESLEVLGLEDFPAPLELRYTARVPGYARLGPDGKLLGRLPVFPANLARRFLARGERRTPLLIAEEEETTLRARLALPPGWAAVGEPIFWSAQTPFGRYRAAERRGPGLVEYEDAMQLRMQRVPVEEYTAFARFLLGVDQAQRREVEFAPGRGLSPRALLDGRR